MMVVVMMRIHNQDYVHDLIEFVQKGVDDGKPLGMGEENMEVENQQYSKSMI